MHNDIILENPHFILRIGADAIPGSLVHKASGRECLQAQTELAIFSVTQPRPFNNEVKLAYPNKQTTFQANRIRQEGDKLIVGFEIIPYEAVVQVKLAPEYIGFALEGFRVKPEDYGTYMCFTPPPVESFRLLQLPVKNLESFGQWLNVMWDDKVAVNVLAACPEAIIDAEMRTGYRVLTADALKEIRLEGTEAALIATDSDCLLDAIDRLERDCGLPLGVESRRNPMIRASSYWAVDVNPGNVDEHIYWCKKCGYTQMTIYYAYIFNIRNGYDSCGNYDDVDYQPSYPEGPESLRKMLQKIKAAGITPGIHFLHPHIGMDSRYVTPVADPRLNLTRHFTLAKPLGLEDDVIFVQQNPLGSVMHEKARVLQFGGELIHYDAYSTAYPYCFTGCKRGYRNTNVVEHPYGQIGGILDVSEYGATSCYLDQNSDLQDEIAEKLGRVYALGFEYIYFDGSEGTNAPFAYHVPNAQYRMWRKMQPAPLYCEGAAKAHFSWHMLTGGNAFDVFGPDVFKEMIRRHPVDEAPRMRQDFTRLNFGWWNFCWSGGFQPDHWEYGCAMAAAWDCPVTVQFSPRHAEKQPHPEDMVEVLRRWEDVRVNQLLTENQKRMLQENPMQEYILLLDETKAYELQPYAQLETSDPLVRAFLFERRGKRWVVYWHTEGQGQLAVDIPDAEVLTELYGAPVHLAEPGIIPADGRKYLVTELSAEEVKAAFAKAKML